MLDFFVWISAEARKYVGYYVRGRLLLLLSLKAAAKQKEFFPLLPSMMWEFLVGGKKAYVGRPLLFFRLAPGSDWQHQ